MLSERIKSGNAFESEEHFRSVKTGFGAHMGASPEWTFRFGEHQRAYSFRQTWFRQCASLRSQIPDTERFVIVSVLQPEADSKIPATVGSADANLSEISRMDCIAFLFWFAEFMARQPGCSFDDSGSRFCSGPAISQVSNNASCFVVQISRSR